MNSGGQRNIANIFPAEGCAALAAINVSHSMVSGCHLTVVRFALNNVNPAHIIPLARPTRWRTDLDVHIFKQVSTTMLPIECLHTDRIVSPS